MNLMEAFTALDNLNEDVFTVDADGIKKLQDFVQNDDTVDELDVFNLDAEPDTVIDENECHVGDAILDCCICHSKIFKPVAEVVVDEESQVANKGEECPYCYSVEGYKVVGEVTPADNDKDAVEINNENNIEVGAEQIEEDIDEVNISTDDVDIEIEDKDSDNEIVVTDNSTSEFDISEDLAESTEYEEKDLNRYEFLVKRYDREEGREAITAISLEDAEDQLNSDGYVEYWDYLPDFNYDLGESITEDTVRKSNGKWTNREDDGTKNFEEKIEELKRGKLRKNSVKEAIDLAAKDNTVAGILRQHMDELSSIYDPNELRNKVIEIVDSSDIADKPVADKLKKALFSKKSVGALLSTIGTYMTGEKVVKTGRYKKAANESVRARKIRHRIIKESSDITLEAKYEMYPSGRITSTRVTGADEFDAFANLLDEVGSYVTSDDVLDMQDEGATIEDVVKQIQSMNGDGSDFIFSIKNITTGKKYFDLDESCRRKSIKESDGNEETIEDKLKKYQMWVDYDMEHYGKVSETTQKIIDEAGLQLIKDQYGDYEVSVGSYKAESFKRSRKGKFVKEGLDSIEITSDDLKVSIETDDEKYNEEVADVVKEPCDECSEEQVVAPVDEETKAKIEFDADDIDEDAIEDAVEECLTESFSNVKFFKCSNLTSRKNRIIVEGILGFKSGKKKNTSFVFRPSLKTESVVKFRGYNKDLRESAKSISLICKKTGKKIIAESLKVKK